MKKFILLILTALMMIGCIEVKSKAQEEKEALGIYFNTTYYTPNGCEYYIYNNRHSGIPLHKQDCKACEKRRKKELEELIIKLKEK